MLLKKINVALVGFGYLGKWHYEKLLKFLNLNVVVVENGPSSQKKIKEQYPNQRVVSELDEILSQIDAALVVTPTKTHYELVKKLLLAKKDVFCEKPLTISFKQSKELHELSLQQEVILQVGHSERFHSVWEKINSSSDKLLIDNCQMCSFFRHGIFKDRAFDVDVVQDLMIHDLDLITFLLNDWPVKLQAFGSKICSTFFDHVEVIMTLESKKIVHLSAGRNFSLEKRSAYFTGIDGCLEVDLIKHQYIVSHPSSSPGPSSFVQKNDHLMIEQEHFFKSIAEKKKVIVDSYQGMRINYLIDQVNQSLMEKKEISLIKL